MVDVSKYLGNAFLKVGDIKVSGPRRVMITDVAEGRYDKLGLSFDDVTRLSCNTTNSRVLATAYGRRSESWVGQEIELFVGDIEYQGKLQEAVLVKPISPPIENKVPPKANDGSNDEIPF
jgi:hypothetical protein